MSATPSQVAQMQALWTALRTLSGETVRAAIALSRRGRSLGGDEEIRRITDVECDRIYTRWRKDRVNVSMENLGSFYRDVLRRSLELSEMD